MALRAGVDLYHDTQTEKLIRRTADRLEIGTPQMYKGFSELTSQLELYRLQLIAKEQDTKPKPKTLTDTEKEEALTFLKSDNLSLLTSELLTKSGIVGEALNKMILWYVFTSRKLQRPLHIVSFGISGVGKSHLQEKVGALILKIEEN